MNLISLQLIAVAFITACACILLGVFLVFRRNSFQGDAVAHSVLFGVVLHYLFFHQIGGVWMYIFAVLSGFLCLFFADYCVKKKWLLSEASIAFSFSAFFAAALVLIALFAGMVHLDADSAMLGELVFTVFDRLVVPVPHFLEERLAASFPNFWQDIVVPLSVPGPLGTLSQAKGSVLVDIGPLSFYVGLGVFFMNLTFVVFFYKPLQIKTFELAYFQKLTQQGVKGFAHNGLLEFILVALTSISAVLALEVVGVVLSVGYFVMPAATAFLLVKQKLWHVFPLAFLFALFAIVVGYFASAAYDISISGTIAVAMGGTFFLVFMFTFFIANEQNRKE